MNKMKTISLQPALQQEPDFLTRASDSLGKHFQIVLLKERGKPCRALPCPDSCGQNGQSSSGKDEGPHEASAHDEMGIDRLPQDNEWHTAESRQKGSCSM